MGQYPWQLLMPQNKGGFIPTFCLNLTFVARLRHGWREIARTAAPFYAVDHHTFVNMVRSSLQPHIGLGSLVPLSMQKQYSKSEAS